MDDDSKEMIKAGAEAAMKPFADLAERLFGGAVDQIGGSWQDWLWVRRQERKIKLFHRLMAKFKKAGIDPHGIADSIWVPCLQEALLQDDETLQDRWANLLANAADPRGVAEVAPAFAVILKELTSREVKLLDALFASASQKLPSHQEYGRVADVPFTRDALLHIFADAGLSRQPRLSGLTHRDWSEHGTDLKEDLREFDYALAVIRRNNVMRESMTPHPIDMNKFMRTAHRTTRITLSNDISFSFSEVCACFVAACHPPKKEAAPKRRSRPQT